MSDKNNDARTTDSPDDRTKQDGIPEASVAAQEAQGTDAEAQENPNGLAAFYLTGQFLEEDGWTPQRLEDQYVYRVFYSTAHGDLACFAQLRVDLEQFLFYVLAPVRSPQSQRLAVAEYITRANYGLRIGNFELDFSDGEVRYKSSIDFEGETLTPNLIRSVVYPAVQTMERYLPGLLSVTYGGRTPEEAIQQIEEEM